MISFTESLVASKTNYILRDQSGYSKTKRIESENKFFDF